MQTEDVTELKHDALDNIIFHMTPRQWLIESGPWVLDRGEGGAWYDVDGREYLDAMAGGLFAVLAGYGREEIARAMYEQALRLNYTSPASVTSPVTIELARRLADLTPGDSRRRSSVTAAPKPSRRRSSSPASITRPTAMADGTRSCRFAGRITDRRWEPFRRPAGALTSKSSVARPIRPCLWLGSPTPCRPTATGASSD